MAWVLGRLQRPPYQQPHLARTCGGNNRARTTGCLGALGGGGGWPVGQPRSSACSCWATFSSSASMVIRVSSSWSSGLRLALPSSSFFSST